MKTDLNERIADFHVRLGRMEERLGVKGSKPVDSPLEDAIEVLSTMAALVFCYYGFGLPNHYYQYVFALLIIGGLYHRESIPRPRLWYDWGLAAANILVLAMLLKLVIGGGDPKPFNWFLYPHIEVALGKFSLAWQETDISQWALPLTVIQTFFFVLTLFGMLVRFDLFCGLTSFVLVLLSLPALVLFNWTWALPAMIASLFSFYLQADSKYD